MRYSKQFMEYIEYAFNAFCKIVLRHEAINAWRDWKRKDIPSQKIRDMLQFMEKSTLENAKSEELRDIYRMMENIKRHSEAGIRYMKSWEIEAMIREEAAREGHAEGHAEGLVDGQMKMLICLVCKKLAKGYDAGTTAEMLGEEEAVVMQIYHAAERFAPKYDVDAIFERLKEEKDFHFEIR